MFDLIIANPPYGIRGRISRQIINELINVAKELVIVSYAQGFSDTYMNASYVIHNDQRTFENMWIQTMTAKLYKEPQNIYKSLMDFRLSSDSHKLKYQRAVENYNKDHKACFEYIGSVKSKTNRPRFENNDCSSLFTIAPFSPSPHHRVSSPIHLKGEDARVNLLNEPINFNKGSVIFGILFDNQLCRKNFQDFYYGFNQREKGWISIEDQKGSLVDYILDCVYTVGGGEPALSYYEPFIPNIDWSKSWSDQDILEEIGLERNFLNANV